jgi:hypothetical protein
MNIIEANKSDILPNRYTNKGQNGVSVFDIEQTAVSCGSLVRV